MKISKVLEAGLKDLAHSDYWPLIQQAFETLIEEQQARVLNCDSRTEREMLCQEKDKLDGMKAVKRAFDQLKKKEVTGK